MGDDDDSSVVFQGSVQLLAVQASKRGEILRSQPMGWLGLESVIHLRDVTKLCNQEINTLNITPNTNINIPVDVSTYLCINTVPRVITDNLYLTLIKLLYMSCDDAAASLLVNR